mmetsp:Transcript_58418/g.136538  ORF Transcript_58418/g.136538 Transcript_58418/m.136538 type:complete len:316 (-) Transcript_58418:130-1077(-)
MWEDDGSNMVKTAPESPMEFTIDGKPGGSPVNALFARGLTPGQYFEIDILQSSKSAFVGVTTREGFAKGWKCKGLFFGGNLSNGGALVRGNFGDWLKTGMKIGVLTELTDKEATVTFYQDGRCLGPAFVAERESGGDVFPVVHTSGEGDRFSISFPEAAPEARERQSKDGSGRHFAEGCWAVKRMSVGPELGEFQLESKMKGEDLHVTIESTGASTFGIGFKVANTLRMTATSAPDDSLAPFERITPKGGMMATMMMGPPELMEVEEALSQHGPSLFKWLSTDGNLMLTGQTIELELVPKSDAPDGLPATEVKLP